MLIVHNTTIRTLIKERYEAEDIRRIFEILSRGGTFVFPPLSNGLFSAATLHPEANYTGYGNVWVRDNIYIAFAHYVNGATGVARKNIRTLTSYFYKHRWRFEKIITGEMSSSHPMNRPHVRFNGDDLAELNEKWAHAQNDALGYFVWMLCKMLNQEAVSPTTEERLLLGLFVFYWNKIEFWKDEDSGHWEEARKIEASSIGVVTGALKEMRPLVQTGIEIGGGDEATAVSLGLLDELIARGTASLDKILPAECVQSESGKFRACDAALLFLVYPMNVVGEEMCDRILENVITHLRGDYGIRRYNGDSYWAPDYKDRVKAEERTVDVSEDMQARNSLLQPGEEAQWCIFDPIISVIYGLKYLRNRRDADRLLQIEYFNRSLGQLTGEGGAFGGLKCPELYYMENGKYTVNDTVPLLWTQANLWVAFKYLSESSA